MYTPFTPAAATPLMAPVIRHKRKMQNFLPCKTSPANNHCDVGGSGVGGTVLYEDLTNIRPRNMMTTNHCLNNQTSLPPMERLEDNTLLDVKCSNYGGAGFTSVGDTAFSCLYPLGAPLPASSSSSLQPKDNMYEEISASSDGGGGGGGGCQLRGGPLVRSAVDSDTEPEEEEDEGRPGGRRRGSGGSSEGELAGDELSLVDFPCAVAEPEVNGVVGGSSSRHCSETSSLRGSTGDDLCRDFEDDGRRAGAPPRVHNNSNNNNNNLFAGPTLFLSNTEQRKRRRNRGRHNGVDLVRLPPQYHNSVGRPVNGNHSPWMPRSTSSGGPVNGGGGSWREGAHNNRYDDYDLAEGGPPSMLLALPPASFNTTGHMHRSCSSHSPQQAPPPMTELNVPKLSLPYQQQQQQQQPRASSYRDSPRDSGHHDEWDGPEASGGGLHERTIGEFNSFRPRRNNNFRDGYGVLAPAYFVNHSPHLATSGHRADGSKSLGGVLGGGPGALYPYHHISKQHPPAHFFPELEQTTQPSQNRKKGADAMDSNVNSRTVIT